jgi:hypothetical protein
VCVETRESDKEREREKEKREENLFLEFNSITPESGKRKRLL